MRASARTISARASFKFTSVASKRDVSSSCAFLESRSARSSCLRSDAIASFALPASVAALARTSSSAARTFRDSSATLAEAIRAASTFASASCFASHNSASHRTRNASISPFVAARSRVSRAALANASRAEESLRSKSIACRSLSSKSAMACDAASLRICTSSSWAKQASLSAVFRAWSIPWNPPSGSYNLQSGCVPVCTTFATAAATVIATATSSSATGFSCVTIGCRRSSAAPLAPPPGIRFAACFVSRSSRARFFKSGSSSAAPPSSSPSFSFKPAKAPLLLLATFAPNPSSSSIALRSASFIAFASSNFSRSAARFSRAAVSASSAASCRFDSSHAAIPRTVSDPATETSGRGNGGFLRAFPAASSANSFASNAASNSRACFARICVRVGGGLNVLFGCNTYGSNRLSTKSGPPSPPPSVTSRCSSSSARSLASVSLACFSAFLVSKASSFARIARDSAGVGFGNKCDGESGMLLMDGSSVSVLGKPVGLPSSSKSKLTRNAGDGRSAHTSASWPELPHKPHTAPSRPRGSPSRCPSRPGATAGMRASNGCERCCAKFAAVSSRCGGGSRRRRPKPGGAVENDITPRRTQATRGGVPRERAKVRPRKNGTLGMSKQKTFRHALVLTFLPSPVSDQRRSDHTALRVCDSAPAGMTGTSRTGETSRREDDRVSRQHGQTQKAVA